MTENVAPAQTPEAGVRPRGFKDLHEGILGEFAERGAFAVIGTTSEDELVDLALTRNIRELTRKPAARPAKEAA